MLRLIALALAAQAATGGQVFSDPDGDFSLTVPDGFVLDSGDGAGRSYLVCWLNTIDMRSWMRLCVMELDGELARRDGPADAPGARGESFRWKGFDIPGIRMSGGGGADGDAGAMFQALVPLKWNAVRLTMMSPAIDADRARVALVSVIASLEGESNWVPSTERAEKSGQAVGQIGMLIMAVGVGMWIMQRRQKKAAPDSTKLPKR